MGARIHATDVKNVFRATSQMVFEFKLQSSKLMGQGMDSNSRSTVITTRSVSVSRLRLALAWLRPSLEKNVTKYAVID